MECDVLARAGFRASEDAIGALRRSPGTLAGVPIVPSLLRHADEQTVVGLAAVLRAIDEVGLDPNGFDAWGVVASPRYLGRGMFFQKAFPQFLAEGAWGVSPHLISGHSLHSLSGAVSQALGAHGPNLGAGGGPGVEDEAFVLAAALLEGGMAPGVWVVVSGWDGVQGAGDAGDCFAHALALGPARAGGKGPRLRVAPDGVHVAPRHGGAARVPLLDWLTESNTRGGA